MTNLGVFHEFALCCIKDYSLLGKYFQQKGVWIALCVLAEKIVFA